MDKISRLIGRSTFSCRVFFNSSFCGSNRFQPDGKAGQLHIVLGGEAHFLHEGRAPLVVRTPALVFYPCGLHHVLQVPASATLVCASVHFDGGGQNLLAAALPEVGHIELSAVPVLERLAGLARAELERNETGQDLALDRLCDLMMVEVMRQEVNHGRLSDGALPGLLDERLGRAISAIHARPSESWTVEGLAGLAGMSRSKFAAYFHDVVGLTPGDYLLRHRLRTAMDLLRQGLPVKSVCHRVGYSNQPAFSRMFSLRTGYSPREWLALEMAQRSAVLTGNGAAVPVA